MGGSAISQINRIYSIKIEDWIKTSSTRDSSFWKNKSTLEELEEYEFVVNDSTEFKTYKEIFELRYQSDYLVSTKYINVDDRNGLCTTVVRGSVFIEKIPIKLSDINEIPFPDILHFYSQCFRGFGELYLKFGYFEITEEMIGSNQNGKVKVWMNSNFSSFKKEINFIKPQGSQTEMMQKLMQLLDLNTNQEQSQSLYLFINNKNPLTFLEASQYLDEYSRKYRDVIPAASNCLSAMTHVLKNNQISINAFQNSFQNQIGGKVEEAKSVRNQSNQRDVSIGQISRFTLNGNQNLRSTTNPPVTLALVSFQPYERLTHKPLQTSSSQKQIISKPPQISQNYYPTNYYLPTQQNRREVSAKKVSFSPQIIHSNSYSLPKTFHVQNPENSVKRQQIVQSKNLITNQFPVVHHSPSRTVELKSIRTPLIKNNHQISPKQTPNTLRRQTESLIRPTPLVIKPPPPPNNEYYSNFVQSKSTKYTTSSSQSQSQSQNSLTNRFNQLKISANKSPSKSPNTSVFKQPSITWTPIQRINRFTTPENVASKKLDDVSNNNTSQKSIQIIQRKNPSRILIPESMAKISINTIIEEHQPTINQYGINVYQDKPISDLSQHNDDNSEHLFYSDESIKPRFPTPQIINIRQKQYFSTQQQPQTEPIQQPRGGVYVKKKVPSLQYIHSMQSYSSIPTQNVRVSYQSNDINLYNQLYNNSSNFNSYNNLANLNSLRLKQTTQSREDLVQTFLSHDSKDIHIRNIDKVIESPVEFRIRREDYSANYQYEYPNTLSNLNNFKINNQEYSESIYKGITGNRENYLGAMDDELKEDYLKYQIKISSENENVNDI